MKNAVILHGTDGTPDENWFKWTERELIKRGYRVWLPQLPGANKPNVRVYNRFLLVNWVFDSETLLIGHSSGAVAILSLLQNLPKGIVIDKAILVAGFINNLHWDALNDLFIHKYNWKKIKTKARNFVLIHSDDDPYVPLDHGKFLQNKLDGKLLIEKGQKHFSVGSFGEKYKKFPILLKFI